MQRPHLISHRSIGLLLSEHVDEDQMWVAPAPHAGLRSSGRTTCWVTRFVYRLANHHVRAGASDLNAGAGLRIGAATTALELHPHPVRPRRTKCCPIVGSVVHELPAREDDVLASVAGDVKAQRLSDAAPQIVRRHRQSFLQLRGDGRVAGWCCRCGRGKAPARDHHAQKSEQPASGRRHGRTLPGSAQAASAARGLDVNHHVGQMSALRTDAANDNQDMTTIHEVAVTPCP